MHRSPFAARDAASACPRAWPGRNPSDPERRRRSPGRRRDAMSRTRPARPWTATAHRFRASCIDRPIVVYAGEAGVRLEQRSAPAPALGADGRGFGSGSRPRHARGARRARRRLEPHAPSSRQPIARGGAPSSGRADSRAPVGGQDSERVSAGRARFFKHDLLHAATRTAPDGNKCRDPVVRLPACSLVTRSREGAPPNRAIGGRRKRPCAR